MKKHFVFLLIAITLLFSICGCSNKNEKAFKPIVWEELFLGEIIPMTDLTKSELGINYTDRLTISVPNCSKVDFDSYLSLCADKGFTIDGREDGIRYYVYNQDGYRLELTLYSTDEMYILLDAPLQATEFGWPDSGIGAQLPSPQSNMGYISWNNETLFCVQVANMPIEAYEEYVETCMKAGFNVDYRRNENTFTAKNSIGYEADINYEGFNTIYISVTPPEQLPEIPDTPSTSTEVNTDFRSAMDSYEKFFDEYIAFMQKYTNNPTDLSLLSEYSNFLSQYTDTMNKMTSIDTSSLSADDLAYYLEVTGRIYDKLGDLIG